MATVTKTYKGDDYDYAVYVATITNSASNLNITDSSFTLTSILPSITGKITYPGLNMGSMDLSISPIISNYYTDYLTYSVGATTTTEVSWSSGATKTVTRRTSPSAQQTSRFFSSANKTVRTLSVTYAGEMQGMAEDTRDYSYDGLYTKSFSFNLSQTVTLDVPPTFSETFSYTGDFSDVPYAGLTTANVSLSSLTAYYGGDFTGVGKAEFTIGSQTVSKANPVNSDVLSIPLNSVGTFTPTVKVTDSRGQVTTHTLSAITVQGYVAPSVNFNVERTTSTGKLDDEGVYAVISPTFIFTDAIATLVAPTIAVTDDGGITQTVSTTWYSTRAADGTLSGSVTWANLSSGDKIYGLVSITNGFNTQKSYQISVTPEDSQGTGTIITQTLGGAYYTVDFYAGGHGIAFGQPASQDGFFCNMDSHFVDKANVMRALFDFMYPVGSYYETSDTSFNPNDTWGGTWSLETAGQVHVSAGTGYSVAGALTDTSDGGASTVTLDATMIPAHTHGSRSLTGYMRFRRYGGTANAGYITTGTSGIVSSTTASGQSGANGIVGNTTASSTHHQITVNATHTHDSVGGGQAHNNMQPYIIVNRWHRTA